MSERVLVGGSGGGGRCVWAVIRPAMWAAADWVAQPMHTLRLPTQNAIIIHSVYYFADNWRRTMKEIAKSFDTMKILRKLYSD